MRGEFGRFLLFARDKVHKESSRKGQLRSIFLTLNNTMFSFVESQRAATDTLGRSQRIGAKLKFRTPLDLITI